MHVVEDVNQVKDITKITNKELKKGFNETQGKLIWLTFWLQGINRANYQVDLDHIEDVICLNITRFLMLLDPEEKDQLVLL